MPKEVIATCGNESLVVSWTDNDDRDPMIAVGSWRDRTDPSGSASGDGPDPNGTQWALTADGAAAMADALTRARADVFPVNVSPSAS